MISFQSLSGFLGRCNARQRPEGHTGGGFNPYRVFSGAATGLCDDLRVAPHWFQSLSGFLGRCNRAGAPLVLSNEMVSIPIGFSRALQPRRRDWRLRVMIRFNPYRVFSGAATQYGGGRKSFRGRVSIPIGFSRALQLRLVRRVMSRSFVSIPIGFSRALQLKGS